VPSETGKKIRLPRSRLEEPQFGSAS